ncbi:MAG: acyl-CoA thioester hydrolase/BAAT C-terminal domain-containing protein [Pseudomonadota bacterium]
MGIHIEGRCTDGVISTPFSGPLNVKIDLPAGAQTVRLTARYRDQQQRDWVSEVVLPEAASGRSQWRSVTDSPLTGSYEGVDPGGLIWSARPVSQSDLGGPVPGDASPGDLDTPLSAPLAEAFSARWRLSFECDAAVVAECAATRDLSTNVRWRALRHRLLRGVLFEPRSPATRPALGAIILGGSEGGAPLGRAAALAEAGISALALGYFAYEDRPALGCNLPLEYFFEAVDWLCTELGVARIGLFGSSRGSEAAAYTASQCAERIGAVVLQAPSPVCNGGLSDHDVDFRLDDSAMWSLDGHALRVPPFPPESSAEAQTRAQAMAQPPGHRFAPEFAALWESEGYRQLHQLPVAACPAPFLLLAGADDGLWPSALGARWLAQQRQGQPTQTVIYPGVGHALRPPIGPDPWSSLAVWHQQFGVTHGCCDYGGSPARNAAAGADSLQRTAHFFHEHLSQA